MENTLIPIIDLHAKFLELVSELTGSPFNDEMSREEVREKIAIVEAKMKLSLANGEIEEENFELKHNFTGDSYLRSIFLPAGSFIVGKLHKHKHSNFIEHGKVSVLTEFGCELLIAPTILISEAGTKRLLMVHEDTVWTGIHVTESQDLDEIEEQVIAKNYAQIGWIDPVVNLKLLGG